MRKLIYEEPIVPVFIDRDKELQAYYSCVADLVKEPIASPQYNPYPPGPPTGQWQPPPGQYGYPQPGYGYPPQPQGGYPSAPQQPYPQMPTQPQYSTGYPQNPAYPTYPPNPGYYPTAQPNQYPPQQGYAPYGQYQPPSQPGWGGYDQSYTGYGQPTQPTPTYPPYYGGQPGAPPPVQDYVTKQHRSGEHSSYGEEGNVGASAPPSDGPPQNKPLGFGWNEMLFSDSFLDSTYSKQPPTSYDSYYSGMSPVEENISVSKASTDHVNNHYMKQFERLNIGWNV